ncbi:hypothetical protein ACQPYK_47640 [Streptosporangium sp. CA-135522]|uniref:hypothetical protein n=1 Tax=Streptosporangium sp. CA-135522 TaxID=3240072 RepID=UPI003D8C6AF0
MRGRRPSISSAGFSAEASETRVADGLGEGRTVCADGAGFGEAGPCAVAVARGTEGVVAPTVRRGAGLNVSDLVVSFGGTGPEVGRGAAGRVVAGSAPEVGFGTGLNVFFGGAGFAVFFGPVECVGLVPEVALGVEEWSGAGSGAGPSVAAGVGAGGSLLAGSGSGVGSALGSFAR